MCVYYFFFFKQKTAYEMRISDWSSDVCSSDLRMAERDAAAVRIDALVGKTAQFRRDAGLVAQKIFVLHRLDVEQHLRRERLVQFPQRNVFVFQADAREQARNRE